MLSATAESIFCFGKPEMKYTSGELWKISQGLKSYCG